MEILDLKLSALALGAGLLKCFFLLVLLSQTGSWVFFNFYFQADLPTYMNKGLALGTTNQFEVAFNI